MRLEVTSTGFVLTRALRAEARRRLLLAVSRFGPEIRGVRVRLGQSRNPLGGLDPCCRLQARLQSGVVLQAEAFNGQIQTAIARSAARLALRVAAALDGHPTRLDRARR